MWEEIKVWLESEGFTIGRDNMKSEMNTVDWYAWRRIDGIDCECNDKPPSLVIWPYRYNHSGQIFEPAEIEIIGKRKGVWWKLKAYAIQAEDVKEKLPMIEKNLVHAWNGLGI